MKKKLPKVKNKLFESVTGTIRFTLTHPDGSKTVFPETHNLITDDFRRLLFQADSRDYATVAYQNMLIVCGSGTAAPQKTDYALTSPYNWGNIEASGGGYAEILTRHSGTICFCFTIPADPAYVGTITEVGLQSPFSVYYKSGSTWTRRSPLITHSLLKDSEGNPYTVNKTSIDQLTIEYIIHINASALELTQFLCFNGGSDATFTVDGVNKHAMAFVGFSLSRSYIRSEEPLIQLFNRWSSIKIIGDFLYGNRDSGTTFVQFEDINKWMLRKTQVIFSGSSISYYSNTPYDIQTYADDTDTINYPIRRIRANWANNGRYYFGYRFSPITLEVTGSANEYNGQGFFIKRFVEDLNMPTQALPIKAIGTGDGATVEFIPPYDYWKENTEKIYVNGVLQTRGVDYTCDNFRNYNNLPELLPLTHATMIDADWIPADESWSDTTIYAIRDERYLQAHCITIAPKAKKIIINPNYYYDPYLNYVVGNKFRKKFPSKGSTFTPEYYYYYGLLTARKGITFELPLDDINLPFKVNTLYLAQYKYESNMKNPLVTVSCSDDNVNWTTVITNATSFSASINTNPENRELEDWLEYPLGQDYVKRYWKFEVIADPAATGSRNYLSLLGICLKHKGQNIIFTNPPAAGASITMEADTDILYKDTHNVIDIGETVTFSS